jgi:hypothetical protein
MPFVATLAAWVQSEFWGSGRGVDKKSWKLDLRTLGCLTPLSPATCYNRELGDVG